MKIAYIGVKGLPSKGGAERVVEAIARRLGSQHEVVVYCNARYTPADTEVPRVKLIRVPTLPGKHLQPVSLFVTSALHALFRGDYDLVHLHNAEACFVAPLLRLRYRLMATSHGAAYARAKWSWLGRKFIRLIDYFYISFPQSLTSVSLPLAQDYKLKYGRWVHYLPNGVDDNPGIDEEASACTLQANGAGSGYILFAAGRMDPTKGCHLLLDAFASLDGNQPLVVIGDMSTVPAYGKKLHLMANGRVTFIPFIKSKPELFGIVRQARFFVFPSTVEAMSMMLLEVASLGVPVVCSDIPENTSVLGEHAVYFKSGDAGDLAEKLKWAVDNSERMAEMGRIAQEWVRQNYDWDTIIDQYRKLYEADFD